MNHFFYSIYVQAMTGEKFTREGDLGGHGLDLPGTPWVCLHEGHKVGDTVEQVVGVKVQDPIILNDSGGHDDLHLADTSVHRVPRQLGLKNREQVACRCFANR